ncbi:sulfide:quinone oxidoreductase [Hydrogenophaga palleronii]|uniref:Sulfide:quinone oxidoreductase n=1 Tax=Hydrogenophaga palleronii TaxID=65655 RepID=A0ABU1WIW0_9BURK|nr:FAD/NAD(P)-binding oxidoreductase [Hydrogenophaga palleronii]MDR7149208.1 sulfide:quinone oxidoreductase [Hydrogenophaga palleronii]
MADFQASDHRVEAARRRFLVGLGALPLAATLAQTSTKARASSMKSSARIVIAGGGAAGLAVASRLAAALDGASITVIDGRKAHYYQPGFTLVASGIKPQDYVVSSTGSYIPAGVEWVAEKVAEIDPDSNKITTESGKTIAYDFLILATGLELHYAGIEGMDTTRIGQNGMGSIYHSPEGASATWKAMSGFADKGGIGLFGRPAGEMKCAGAPLKYTFVTDDYLRRRGNRSKAEMIYMAQSKSLFGVPIVAEKVRMLFQDRGVKVNHEHVLQAIDLDKRIATYKTPAGSVEQNYDFINVVPPMRAPEVVRNSPLPWTEGPFAADGWVEVDRETLRHKRYPNVFGVGDIAGVPKGKTAASVKWQVPVAISHLLGDISGKPSTEVYNGYTSCPLITRLGQAMLIEFDYKDNLIMSFPSVIAPLEELWISWVMKTMALKPTYISMLRGNA